MKRATSVIGLALLAAACGGGGEAKSPRGPRSDLAGAVVDAARVEATEGDERAAAKWLDVVDAAVAATDDPWQIAAEEAALDALVSRTIPSFVDLGDDDAIAYRVKDAGIEARLTKAAERASDPFTAGLLAGALDAIATHHGDAVAAARWRAQTGCAESATIIGPLTWTAVTGVAEADPLADAKAPIAATYAQPGAFARPNAPVVVSGRGCSIDPTMVGVAGGVRDVVIDARVDRAQRIGVALHARSTAQLRVGGRVVIERPYAFGGEETAQLARVDVPAAGTLRIVARVGMEDDAEGVEVDVWDDHGKPLPTHAPQVGESAGIAVTSSSVVAWPAAKSDAERTALSMAALAAGEQPTAEEAVATEVARTDAPPALLLAYARAVEQADDLDTVHRDERARGAYERVLDAWPGAWEAIAAHALLAGDRRGLSEQRIWTLKDLAERRAKAGSELADAAVLDAIEAGIAGHDRLHDRAHAALERARARIAGSAVLRDADRAAHERTGAERVAFECSQEADADRGRLECYDALRASGDRARAAAEVERVRALYGAPSAYLALTLREAVSAGDLAAAARAYTAMLPGERTLAAAYAVKPGESSRDPLVALAPYVRDAPTALSPLFRASGEDPAAAFAGVAERVTAEDRAKPILPGAATAILAHSERFDVAPNGVVRFVLFDVRRVSGTTDVEENAQADPPNLSGRVTMRIVRRRILKKDGRVLEPDRTPGAAQAHADLSQLEQGDSIEAIYEGWSLPSDAGQVTIDTADLFPERMAVHEATIELRTPATVPGALWSHPLLGKVEESRQGETRVLKWTVKDTDARRLEDGTPKMDRDVGVSWSTATWADTARALRETLASLEDRTPDARAWAVAAAKGKTKPREIVDAVVEAAGRDVKESGPGLLSDLEIGRPQGAQSTTARSILSTHEGSRTWLVVRALRELGIAADVAIAENEPFSADPRFPPHDGRFTHPLAIAHVKDDAGGKGATTTDVWIDADVAGPPLPAGRVSPELRGRAVIYADGTIGPVPPTDSTDERDEVDVRLKVDEKGDAKGSLTILLRGRAAQELAEALVRIVGDERQRMLRGVALAWVPFADVDDVVLSSTEESWQVAIRATLTVHGFAQAEGSGASRTWVVSGVHPVHAVYPRPTVQTLGATYVSQGARTDALAINRAMQFHVHRRIELPAGAVVTRAPGALDVKDAILTAQRRIAVAPALLEDDLSLSMATGTIPAADYAAFAADAHKVDDGFLASARVKPGP